MSKFENLPYEIILNIIRKQATYEDIINLCRVNRDVRAVCKDQYLWKKLVKERYPEAYKKGIYPNIGYEWEDVFRRQSEKPLERDIRSFEYNVMALVSVIPSDAHYKGVHVSEVKRNLLNIIVPIFKTCYRIDDNVVIPSLSYCPSLDIFVGGVWTYHKNTYTNAIFIVSFDGNKITKVYGVHPITQFVSLFFMKPFELITFTFDSTEETTITHMIHHSLSNKYPESFVTHYTKVEESMRRIIETSEIKEKYKGTTLEYLKKVFDMIRSGILFHITTSVTEEELKITHKILPSFYEELISRMFFSIEAWTNRL